VNPNKIGLQVCKFETQIGYEKENPIVEEAPLKTEICIRSALCYLTR
jgi:hypothetical protein